MNLASFLLILLGVLLNAAAQLLLKRGTQVAGALDFSIAGAVQTGLKIASQWPFLLGFACYGISVVVWIAALSRVPVTIAYPMLSIGYVVNALIARFWLGENLNLAGWVGMGFIIVGVYILARQATA